MSDQPPLQPPCRSSLADDPNVREVIPVFVARLPGHVKRLRELLAAGDAEGLKMLAHKLRGAGQSFGFEPITRHAAAIEEILLAGKPVTEAAPAVGLLEAYMRGVEGFKDE